MDKSLLAQELAEIADELDAKGKYVEANRVSLALARLASQGMERESQVVSKHYYTVDTGGMPVDVQTGIPVPQANEDANTWWARVKSSPLADTYVQALKASPYRSFFGIGPKGEASMQGAVQGAFRDMSKFQWQKASAETAPGGVGAANAEDPETKAAADKTKQQYLASHPDLAKVLKDNAVPDYVVDSFFDDKGVFDSNKMQQYIDAHKAAAPAAGAAGGAATGNPLELGQRPQDLSIPELQQAIDYYRRENVNLKAEWEKIKAGEAPSAAPPAAPPAAAPPAAPSAAAPAAPPATSSGKPPTITPLGPGGRPIGASKKYDMMRLANVDELAEIADELDARGFIAEASEVDAIMRSMVRSAQPEGAPAAPPAAAPPAAAPTTPSAPATAPATPAAPAAPSTAAKAEAVGMSQADYIKAKYVSNTKMITSLEQILSNKMQVGGEEGGGFGDMMVGPSRGGRGRWTYQEDEQGGGRQRMSPEDAQAELDRLHGLNAENDAQLKQNRNDPNLRRMKTRIRQKGAEARDALIG